MKHSLIPYSQPDGCSNLAHDPRFMMGHCLPRGVQLALAICEINIITDNSDKFVSAPEGDRWLIALSKFLCYIFIMPSGLARTKMEKVCDMAQELPG